MKKLVYLSVLFTALFFSNNAYATIWRVNNTPGVNANFTNPQAAHDAAVAGDTIHIEPSVTNYGNLSCSKPVVIIGNGYQLTTDTGLQANTNNSMLSQVVFNPGSSGSSIQGVIITHYTYLQTPNILVRRNYIQYPVFVNASNLTILDNMFYYYGISSQTSNNTGLNISNNIFNLYGGVSLDASNSGTITNNVFHQSTIGVYNFQVNNNILISGTFTLNNNVYFNNMSDGTAFGTANGNQQNVAAANIFTLNGGTYTDDRYWTLKPGSPAIGSGFNGVDMGAFGGPNPYKLAGIPNVPTIYKLTVPPIGTNSISVTVSTRSNN